MAQFNDGNTSEYYDSYSDVYAAIWSEQMHTGYFRDNQAKSLEQAVQDMNVFLATEASIADGGTVLSVGCGRGGTDRFLATQKKTRVIGIDLSQKQLDEAQKAAQEAGLADQITYIYASMTDIPLEDASVDVVWVQEALFHCHDKEKAVAEFARVLRSGGVTVLEDTVLLEPAQKEEVMRAFGARVHINDIFTPQDYERVFASHGVPVEKNIDLSNDLGQTYRLIAEYIEKNKEVIKQKIAPQHWGSLEYSALRARTLELIEEGGLGCAAIFFRKQ
jgi:ubiquinone/menaquinone biosynthesis C-methylase UbiE